MHINSWPLNLSMAIYSKGDSTFCQTCGYLSSHRASLALVSTKL